MVETLEGKRSDMTGCLVERREDLSKRVEVTCGFILCLLTTVIILFPSLVSCRPCVGGLGHGSYGFRGPFLREVSRGVRFLVILKSFPVRSSRCSSRCEGRNLTWQFAPHDWQREILLARQITHCQCLFCVSFCHCSSPFLFYSYVVQVSPQNAEC